MPFPENFIQELTERSDIVDVVGSYVSLGKRSGANLFGLCPFHNERTPSFAVNPAGQFYHCFGCGKGGGVINFIMEVENLSYPDAVAFLAKRAGMQMPEDSFDRTPENVPGFSPPIGMRQDGFMSSSARRRASAVPIIWPGAGFLLPLQSVSVSALHRREAGPFSLQCGRRVTATGN